MKKFSFLDELLDARNMHCLQEDYLQGNFRVTAFPDQVCVCVPVGVCAF